MNKKNKICTTNVFVDTSIFVSYQLNWRNQSLKRLVELCRNGKVSFLTTDITVRELEKKIINQVQDALNYLKKSVEKTKKIAPSLNRMPQFTNLNHDPNKISRILIRKERSFFRACAASWVPLNEACLHEIIDKYFNGTPPFGEGKKKHEFPDAIVLSSLDKWCKKNKEEISVVSPDGDFKEGCALYPRLTYFENLPEFLEAIFKLHDSFLPGEAINQFEQVETDIKSYVENNLPGYYVDIIDADGEASVWVVNDVNIISKSILDASMLATNLARASFNVTVEVGMEVEATYFLPGSGTYDHEDHKWYNRDSVNDTCFITKELSLEVEIDFEINKDKSAQLQECQFSWFSIEINVLD